MKRFIITRSVVVNGQTIPLHGYWIGPGRKSCCLTRKQEENIKMNRHNGRDRFATYPDWDRALDVTNNQQVKDRKRNRMLHRLGLR